MSMDITKHISNNFASNRKYITGCCGQTAIFFSIFFLNLRKLYVHYLLNCGLFTSFVLSKQYMKFVAFYFQLSMQAFHNDEKDLVTL